MLLAAFLSANFKKIELHDAMLNVKADDEACKTKVKFVSQAWSLCVLLQLLMHPQQTKSWEQMRL
jgi:hypothetical protein